ncbi:MAG: c-type cytochrome [Bryobacteraceae bacterium]
MKPLLSLFLLAGWCIAAPPDGMTKLDRGRYLAVEVGKCADCHTPKTEAGELDKEKWFKGKVMEYQPIEPIADWHKTSPDITPAGRLWGRWGGEAALVKYLMTGLTPKGTAAGPPMPTYKMSKEDAEAIVEYLKTLK